MPSHVSRALCLASAFSARSPAQFRAAIAESPAARDTVKYIFSDSPTSVEGAAEVLPNLAAVAEDALHLVLRVEACTGDSCLLKIQTRFRLPYAAPFFRGHAVEDPPDAGSWSDNLMDKEATETDWDKKAAKPYCSHQEYIDDIQRAWLCGRLRTAWLQGSGWKWVGSKKPLGTSELGCADGLRTAWLQGSGWIWVGSKKPLGTSELGCADGLRTAWVQGGGWKWVGRRSRWG